MVTKYPDANPWQKAHSRSCNSAVTKENHHIIEVKKVVAPPPVDEKATERENFIGSVIISGEDKNLEWINADILGTSVVVA